ncbi:DNA double-strand break repair nuclease NurA [Halonotius sp. GCM10025705]|uniref:DNA double-strand break repair nuclease NurA n=1 Tax=Halonotius sp. GCM10025705 TaxID=3252678 RepID=UPI00360EAB35
MIENIITNYVRVVEGQDRANLPVAGVVKSPTSTQVVSAIEAKAPDEVETPIRWGNDNLFFSEALYNPDDWYGDDGAVISYTTWLVQRQMTPAKADSAFVPLEGLDGVNFRRGDAAEYQTAFFYARIPLQNTVVRVEAPVMTVRDAASRKRIQRKVLGEIAATRSIPFAIDAADEAATISRENRQRLRRELQHATSVRTYNELRGYNDLNNQE